MLDIYLVKALHIIFMVTWFAGLFYIVRLFIYHIEADKKPEPNRSILIKQYKIMEQRLWYIITWPSCVLTLILGPYLLIEYYSDYLKEPWMHLKLGFVLLLLIYQVFNQILYKQLSKDVIKYSSNQMRIWNEVATLLLFIIVFLVVYQQLNFYKGVLGFLGLAVLLMLGIKLYKRNRRLKDEKHALEKDNEEE